MKTVYLLRGVSGSGKTTLSHTLEASLPDCHAVAADDYFTDEDGVYDFDPSELPRAHKWCNNKVGYWMKNGKSNIVVHNTFTSEWEMQPYIDMATDFGYKVVSLVVENRHGNESVHNVPKHVIENQCSKLKNNLKLV